MEYLFTWKVKNGHMNKGKCIYILYTWSISGRWFQIFFYFHPENLWKMNPFWRAYFSDGLVQPPASWLHHGFTALLIPRDPITFWEWWWNLNTFLRRWLYTPIIIWQGDWIPRESRLIINFPLQLPSIFRVSIRLSGVSNANRPSGWFGGVFSW